MFATEEDTVLLTNRQNLCKVSQVTLRELGLCLGRRMDMRRYSGTFCLTLSLSMVAGTCAAATIEPIRGEVYVNHGGGFVRVAAGETANEGDSVMVSPNGSATVMYSDRCTVTVRPGMVIRITRDPPCDMPVKAPPLVAAEAPPEFANLAGFGIAAAVGAGLAGLAESMQSNHTVTPASP
jgi:hypothetical protein